MLANADRTELRPLTSLRFAAAMMVFVYHCNLTSGFGATYALGHSGVGFFFVLSGFILTYSYRADIATGMLRRKLRSFYAARFARIYPVHIVTMLLMLVTLALVGGIQFTPYLPLTRTMAAVAQALLLQTWIPAESIYLGINTPSWSISVEAFFYALFPFVACSLMRTFGHARMIVVLLAASVAWILQTAIFLIPHPVSVWTSYIFPPIRFLDFFTGIMLAIAFLQGRARISRAIGTLTECAAIAAIVVAIALSPHYPVQLRYSLALMPVWGCLIFVFARGAGDISRVLSLRVATRLGEISFSFYLVHASVIAITARLLNHANPVLGAGVAFAAALAASFALFYWVERPMRERLRKALANRSEEKHMEFAFSLNR
jgi:peptidoglycan/LPS O-acetylase OafA/YrhL